MIKITYKSNTGIDHSPHNWAERKVLSNIKGKKILLIRDPDRILKSEQIKTLHEKVSLQIVMGDLELRKAIQKFDRITVLIDQSSPGCFVPDLDSNNDCKIIEIDIIEFLKEITGITSWPQIVREYPCREICKDRWEDFLRILRVGTSHGQISLTNESVRRMSAEAVLGFSLSVEPKLEDALKIAISGKMVWAKLISYFGVQEAKELQSSSKSLPHPINLLLDPNLSEPSVIAIGGLAILTQHLNKAGEALALIDPQFYKYSSFEAKNFPKVFESMTVFQEAVRRFEKFTSELHWEKISDKLNISNPTSAIDIILKEKLSPRIGVLCILSIIGNFLEGEKLAEKIVKYKASYEKLSEVNDVLDNESSYQRLKQIFRKAYDSYKMLSRLSNLTRSLKLKKDAEIEWNLIISPWVNEKLCLAEYNINSLLKDWDQISLPEGLPPWAKQIALGIGSRLKQLSEFAGSLVADLNTSFQRLVKTRYSSDAGKVILTTSEFLKEIVKPVLKKRKTERPTVVILFDGMRYDFWNALFAPIFDTKFETRKITIGLSRLPSNTPYSRRAAFSGLQPKDFSLNAAEYGLLQQAVERLALGKGKVEEIKNLESISKSIKIAIRIQNIDFYFIVLNLSDNLPHNIDYSLPELFGMIKGLSGTVEALINNLPTNPDLFILSDHGFTKLGRKTVTIREGNVNYRYAFLRTLPREDICKKSIIFTSSDLGLSGNEVVLFPQVGWTFLREGGGDVNDFYYHGGVSLEEMIIPFIHLSPRKKKVASVTINIECDQKYEVGKRGFLLINLNLEEQHEAEVDIKSSLPNFSERVVFLNENEPKQVLAEFIPDTEGIIPFSVTVSDKNKILGTVADSLNVKSPARIEREEVEGLKEIFGD
jgi:hypothetical protein